MRTRSILFLLFCCGSFALQAQNCEMPLMITVPQQAESISPETEKYLENRLVRMATENGLSAIDNAQFSLIPRIDVVTKDNLAGPPRNVALNLELSIYLVDYWGEKVFASTTIHLKGVGNNETKAYMNAIRNINPKHPVLQSFAKEGKDKIKTYYDTHYQTIIRQANHLAKQKQFEEALYHLMQIPECCKGYEMALQEALVIYRAYNDEVCIRNLAKAKAEWLPLQNKQGAQRAAEYLQYIYPDAACYDEAMKLYDEIKSKIKDDWSFLMKAYQDTVDIEKQQINAWKEVGVAYGKGQQPTTTHVFW